MKKSKLIQLFSALSSSEIKELGNFLEGLAYKKTGGVFQLYKYLRKYHPEFPEKKIDKEVVHNSLFKDSKKFNRRLYDLMSSLTTGVEMFLINKKIEKDEVSKDFHLLEVYKERQLDKLFFAKVSQVEKDWKKKSIAGIEHLHDVFRLKQMCFTHPNYSKIKETDIDLQDVIDQLDLYYFALKLSKSIAFLHSTGIVTKMQSKESSHRLLQYILTLKDKSPFRDVQMIELLSQIVLAFQEDKEVDKQKILDLLYTTIDQFDQTEQRDLFVYVSTILYEDYRKGIPGGLEKIFQIYKFATENDLLFEDGYIDDKVFIVVVSVACAVKELDWAEEFANTKSVFMSEKYNEDVKYLCHAFILFERKEFGEALKNISKSQFNDAFHALQAKSIQLQCYFEMEDYDDLFYNLVKSFTFFVKRSVYFSEPYKESVYNFIKYANKMHNLKMSRKKGKNKLNEEISAIQNIIKKQWLLDKAEILK